MQHADSLPRLRAWLCFFKGSTFSSFFEQISWQPRIRSILLRDHFGSEQVAVFLSKCHALFAITSQNLVLYNPLAMAADHRIYYCVQK
mmetsp:Transcript_53614/g.160493  ORF Transcript_53614/g.160493 Transcript_53614/m.160493 type:complete len:88 (+) Transcript_53614:241-504(+)